MPIVNGKASARLRPSTVKVGVAALLCLTFNSLVGFSLPANAHPGGLAADGCHNDRQNGGRHCHRGSNAGQQQTQRRDGSVYYPNCDAARRAGATPILRGQPGYGAHLDRDGDGKACE
ncbi:MAG: calcium-binding protein [Erythrobacteraceae bacterium]|nr:calcium-binding protein [Erythrobacteraceae bacterium]